jgi:heptosyltransferase-1
VPEKPNLYVTNRHINPPEGINVRARYLYLVQRYFDDLNAFIPKGVVLKISSEEQAQLNTLCVSFVNQQKPCFMVCFGSRWPNKQLLKATLAQFLLLVDQAIKPFFLLIYGNEEEKRQAEELHAFFKETSLVVGSLSLPLWQALMQEVDGVIAVDSAGLHLAGTTSTPSFSLFGPSLAAIYKPLEERHKAIQGSCPYQLNFKTRCPHLRSCVSGACLHAFSAAELFDSFTNWHGNVYTL